MTARGKRFGVGVSALVLWGAGAAQAAGPGDWPTYGHDPGGMRYSPLKQITAANVAQLKPAWTYKEVAPTPAAAAPGAQEEAQRQAEGAGPPPGAPPNARRRGPRPATSEATPLVADGLMFVTTAYKRVVALEPETGKEVWGYDVKTP